MPLFLSSHDAKLSPETVEAARRLHDEQEAAQAANVERAQNNPEAPKVVAWERSYTVRKAS